LPGLQLKVCLAKFFVLGHGTSPSGFKKVAPAVYIAP
jgi:hypothetical protein